jgi:ubiquinone/menaquinone biosynthesis C-methylase UbiE
MPWLDHFHFLAPIYDRVITAVQPEKLKALLQMPAEGPLLDVGGGTGRVAQTLAPYTDHIVVLDESPGMLLQARDKGLSAVRARAERLPFPNGAVPRILMVDAFHHLSNQTKTIAEMMRVLAPNGRLVIEEPNIEHLGVKLVALAEKLALMRSHFRSPATMKHLFESAGARVQLIRDEPDLMLVAEKKAMSYP